MLNHNNVKLVNWDMHFRFAAFRIQNSEFSISYVALRQ